MEKLYKMLGLLSGEMKTARDYGTGFKIYHAEVHLLETIFNHEGVNLGKLSKILGMTNGAVSQTAQKLLDKALAETYQIPNNKKEVHFRLTDLGLKALDGHREHHAKIDAAFSDFVENRATKKDIQSIMKFMDAIMDAYEPFVARKTEKRE
ncbi:MAG: MarR family transcriptional regulator [Synergistaceae bacterium]|nr:MarR family transcriptional regulator [Synergistaceae bacterium]